MYFTVIKRSVAGAASLALSLLLVGCGGGGASDDVSSSSSAAAESIVLNGGAIKGVVSQGQVNAWSLKRDAKTGKYEAGARLGKTVRTDSQGRFQLPITGRSGGWVVIELSADSETRMTCDVVPACFSGSADAVAFGETFPLSSDFRLRAAVNLSATHDVYLTPLSTLAVALAEGTATGLSESSLASAYQEMEATFNLQAGTLQLPPPDLVRLNGFSGSTDAIQLAVINAAFLALVDGSRWQSIEDVLLDSEALVRTEGGLSTTSKDPSVPSVESVILEAAVLSEGLKTEVSDATVLASLGVVSDRTQAFYSVIASADAGGTEPAPDSHSARLAWDAPLTRVNGDSIAMGELNGYEIVYGRSAGDLTNKIVISSASQTSHTIENLSQGDWYFAVRAVDTDGLVSSLSPIVSKSI